MIERVNLSDLQAKQAWEQLTSATARVTYDMRRRLADDEMSIEKAGD